MVVEHAKAENYYSINIKELSMDDGALLCQIKPAGNEEEHTLQK